MNRRNFKQEYSQDRSPILFRPEPSESDISEEPQELESRAGQSAMAFIDEINLNPMKWLKMEVNL